jgi:hypothetical protein
MIPRRKLFALIGAVLGIAFVLGCYFTAPAALAITRSTNHFLAFPRDTRVRYEPGAEQLAAVVAQALPTAIGRIESTHLHPFTQPIVVHVCATVESFTAYQFGGAGSAGGFVLNRRLFISPKPQNTSERIPRILTHELSHLHLNFALGTWRYVRTPQWFKEGLAVIAAEGGGAESVSEAEARRLIATGRHLAPDSTGHLLPQSARVFGLKEHEYYRQSAMFVAFLRDKDGNGFKSLLLALQDRVPFATALRAAYGTDAETLWREFIRPSR